MKQGGEGDMVGWSEKNRPALSYRPSSSDLHLHLLISNYYIITRSLQVPHSP